MTSVAFLKLNINDRANYLWSNGNYTSVREYYGYKISLYALNGFFVEVWHFINTNEIEKIELLDEKFYSHYLKDIDLVKLLNK